jgi:hypothetical protein
MIYAIVFFISGIMNMLANFFDKNNSKVLYISASALAIFSISYISGIRNSGIGTDMLVYGDYVFKFSTQFTHFSSFYNSSTGVFKLEPGYMALNYIISRFSDDKNFFYFWCSLITNGLIYFSIRNSKKNIISTLAWTSYLLIFYSYTLNIMRQSLALSIMLFGFSIFSKSGKKIGIILMLLSGLFHSSAFLLSLFIIFIFWLCNQEINKNKLILFFTFTSLGLFLFIQPIVNLLMSSGLISQRYEVYIADANGGAGFSILSLLVKIPVIILFLWRYKFLSKKFETFSFFFIVLILDLAFYQIRSVSVVFSRVSLYFYIFQILSVPWIIKKFSSKNEQLIISIIYIVFLIIVWYYQIVISGMNEIYPYKSSILNII